MKQVPIVPYGGATSLEGQTLAPHGGVCIDMSLMKVSFVLNIYRVPNEVLSTWTVDLLLMDLINICPLNVFMVLHDLIISFYEIKCQNQLCFSND